ncbi:hypothetical protein HY405_02070 [Candidatus Microgenomates bacterium]|nr:hypothetical protein [Candidatus Microgenomates bacterium]
MSNTCTRCGKLRIPSKTWKEVIEIYGRTSTITHTEYVCADSDCQKVVEKQLLVTREKHEAITRQKEQEQLERAKRLAASHV